MECARIAIPKLTSLTTEPCILELEGVLFRIRPRIPGGGDGDALESVAGAPAGGLDGDGCPGLGDSPPDGFVEGLRGLESTPVSVAVASIAGGVETILQRAQVKVAPPPFPIPLTHLNLFLTCQHSPLTFWLFSVAVASIAVETVLQEAQVKVHHHSCLMEAVVIRTPYLLEAVYEWTHNGSDAFRLSIKI